MLFMEFLALVGVIGLSGVGLTGLITRYRARSIRLDQAIRAGHDALRSEDFKKIDEVLVLYNDVLPGEVKELLKQRRDELFIDRNWE